MAAMSARETALITLTACEQQGAWSDGFLKHTIHSAGLDSRDAAFATRLCYGVLQNKLRLDFYIDTYSTIQSVKMEPKIRNTVRLGIYQMAFLDRVPHSAAVNEAVVLAKKYAKNPRAAGLVNGVLRNISRNIAALPKPESRSIWYSHPQWLVDLMYQELKDWQQVEALLAANNEQPPTVAQVNTCYSTAEEVSLELINAGVTVEAHPWLENCLILSSTGNIEEHPAFQTGKIYIQDAAARLAIIAANPHPGMRILDACAAPGGKSFAAAIQMQNRGDVISCDIHAHKQKLIQAGATRLGLTCIKPSVQDAKENIPDFEKAFDLVIADVPCSGLGIIRKKPDIRFKDPGPLMSLPAVQASILDNIAMYVKPGGSLLYVTCTLLRRENDDIIEAFLDKHIEYTREPFQLPGPAGYVKDGSITLWPHIHQTDGFYMAHLRRRAW